MQLTSISRYAAHISASFFILARSQVTSSGQHALPLKLYDCWHESTVKEYPLALVLTRRHVRLHSNSGVTRNRSTFVQTSSLLRMASRARILERRDRAFGRIQRIGLPVHGSVECLEPFRVLKYKGSSVRRCTRSIIELHASVSTSCRFGGKLAFDNAAHLFCT